MKRTASFFGLVIIALIGLSQPLFSQTAKEIFNSSETPITYLGVDFTQAKLIGDAAADAVAFKSRHFSSINQVVVNEPKKYDIAKALQKSNVSTDINVTETVNSSIDADGFKSQNSADDKRLDAAAIQKVVKNYKLNGKKGIGLVFIMESMNKTAKTGSMYVTFIDMPSAKVLHTERLTGKAQGFGDRNYWAKTIYEVLEQIEKSKYKEWKNKYQ